MSLLVATKAWAQKHADGYHAFVLINGEEWDLGVMYMPPNPDGAKVDEMLKAFLKTEDIIVQAPAPVEQKPKRKYTRHVQLGLASEHGKVTLTLADTKRKINVYHLYLKGTDKFVYKLDQKGIYVTSAKSTKPLNFTDEDMKLIKNIADFDVVKEVLHIRGNNVRNKIAK